MLVVLGCVEKLASVANTVAIERDWVIVIVETNSVPRHELNARLRRLDLLSKLTSPFFVSLLDTLSTSLAIWTVMITNIVTVFVENRATRRIYDSIPELAIREQAIKPVNTGPSDIESDGLLAFDSLADDHDPDSVLSPPPPSYQAATHPSWLPASLSPWSDYVQSPVFIASFANSMLYWTVLTFSGQTVTFLLSGGFSPLEISFFRIASVLAELTGTWFAPPLMRRVGPVKAALYNMLWQVACIAPFAGSILSPSIKLKTMGGLLSAGIILKRPGLMGGDLAIQFIVQEATPDASRMRFSSTEVACQNVFEMLSFATTAIWQRPQEFRVPVFMSYACLVAATVLYSRFAVRNRGRSYQVPAAGPTSISL